MVHCLGSNNFCTYKYRCTCPYLGVRTFGSIEMTQLVSLFIALTLVNYSVAVVPSKSVRTELVNASSFNSSLTIKNWPWNKESESKSYCNSMQRGRGNCGRCLDMAWGRGNGESAILQLWACHHFQDRQIEHQMFASFRNKYDGGYLFMKHGSDGVDYCIDVPHAKAVPGARVQWWRCNWSDAQKWFWDPRSDSFRSALNRDLCLDAAGGWNNHRNGQPLLLWHCHGGPEQAFRGMPIGHWNTDVMPDLQQDCARRGQFCNFRCRNPEKGCQLVFDGVKAICGLSAAAPFCSAVVPLASHLTCDRFESAACRCECTRSCREDPDQPHCGRSRPTLAVSRPPASAPTEPSAQ
ncbi:ricin B lectin domain-containing protein [Paraphysoderma sedebokerense]|nr:ricin B lectin domain-containing protein [Paraphysoderma sedebokerense]